MRFIKFMFYVLTLPFCPCLQLTNLHFNLRLNVESADGSCIVMNELSAPVATANGESELVPPAQNAQNAQNGQAFNPLLDAYPSYPSYPCVSSPIMSVMSAGGSGSGNGLKI